MLVSLLSAAYSFTVFRTLKVSRSNADRGKKGITKPRHPIQRPAPRSPASNPVSDADRAPFLLEAMVAAGPRKYADPPGDPHTELELGEDSVGFIVRDARWIFWLCDGTSGGDIFPRIHLGNDATLPFRFSSRSLAQSVGEIFAAQTCFAFNEVGAGSPPGLMHSVFAQLEAEWQRRLASYFSHISAADAKKLLGALPPDDRGFPFAKWSTTFLGGVFDEHSRALQVASYGDSGLIVATATTERPSIVPPNERRLILTATFPNDGRQPRVRVHSGDDANWRSFENVEGFIAMSDGVTPRNASLSTFLPRVNANVVKFPLGRVREMLLELVYHSGDDKSIIFGRFLSRT